MKKQILLITIFAVTAAFSSVAHAENSSMGGKGKDPLGRKSEISAGEKGRQGEKGQKAGAEQAEEYNTKEEHKNMDDLNRPGDRDRDQLREHQDDAQGLEKQREMKQGQVQKELGRGSEQGQQSREQRKKWWQFWGDE